MTREYDTTAFRQVTETLSRPDVREAEFEVMFDSPLCGVAFVAKDGLLLKVNKRYAALIGYVPSELQMRKTWQSITHPEDIAPDVAESEKLVSDPDADPYQMVKRYIHKLGHTVWVNLSVARVEAADGEFIHFLAQTKELRLADHQVRVATDASGQPVLCPAPAATLDWLLKRHWKWVATIGVPAVISVAAGAGATVKTYYVQGAQIEYMKETEKDREEIVRELRESNRSLQARIDELTKTVRQVVPPVKPKTP